MHGNRDVVADRAVGSVLVVVSTPILQLFSGIRKAHEPMCVQAFRAELAVEGLDEAIVCGLSWPQEVQRNVVGIGPEIEIARDEFAGVLANQFVSQPHKSSVNSSFKRSGFQGQSN